MPETTLETALRLARNNLHGPAGTKVLADEVDRLRFEVARLTEERDDARFLVASAVASFDEETGA